jgi:hypothetical protein
MVIDSVRFGDGSTLDRGLPKITIEESLPCSVYDFKGIFQIATVEKRSQFTVFFERLDKRYRDASLESEGYMIENADYLAQVADIPRLVSNQIVGYVSRYSDASIPGHLVDDEHPDRVVWCLELQDEAGRDPRCHVGVVWKSLFRDLPGAHEKSRPTTGQLVGQVPDVRGCLALRFMDVVHHYSAQVGRAIRVGEQPLESRVSGKTLGANDFDSETLLAKNFTQELRQGVKEMSLSRSRETVEKK